MNWELRTFTFGNPPRTISWDNVEEKPLVIEREINVNIELDPSDSSDSEDKVSLLNLLQITTELDCGFQDADPEEELTREEDIRSFYYHLSSTDNLEECSDTYPENKDLMSVSPYNLDNPDHRL